MTIDDLYKENKYEAILYYLKENGISSIEELHAFDFELLYFVPGVSEDEIKAAKALFDNCQNDKNVSMDNDTLSEFEDVFKDIIEENVQLNLEGDTIQDNFTNVINSLDVLIKNGVYTKKLKEYLCDNRYRYGYTYEEYNNLKHICSYLEECIKQNKYSFNQECILKNTLIENEFIDVTTKSGRRCGGPFIRYCLENGYKTLWDLQDLDFDSLNIRNLGFGSLLACKEYYKNCVDSVLSGYNKGPILESPKEKFIKAWHELKERDRYCMVKSTNGATLQTIGEELGLTRERVRQLKSKVLKKMKAYAVMVSDELIKKTGISFSVDDVADYFDDTAVSEGFICTLKETPDYTYIPFAEKFFIPLSQDWELILKKITKDLIGDGLNYYANLEVVEEALQKEGLECFDFYDYLSYLTKNGYKLYGEFVAKKSHAYTLICLDAIKRNFCSSIKLDADENNLDLIKLREVVKANYGNYDVPSSNRAVTARLADYMVLCGRGRYCLAEYIDCPHELIEEIVEFINTSKESTFYYIDLFNSFRGRLLMESNIDNHNFLHGVLKYLYPEEFNYERDSLTKLGYQKVSFEDKLVEIICDFGGAVNREYLEQKISYINDARLNNVLNGNSGVIVWGYNQFNHMDNIVYTLEDKDFIKEVLEGIVSKNKGYCNERELYYEIKKLRPAFLFENKMDDALNLFYVAQNWFSNEFRFSRPHIASQLFPDVELTNVNIVKYLISGKKEFSYSYLVDISLKQHWSNSVLSLVTYELEDDYIRLNRDDYLKDGFMELSEEDIAMIERTIEKNMGYNNYVALFAAFNYNTYPDIGYEWNEFILHSIINKFCPYYKVLEPRTRDRRYKRGIIVRSNNVAKSYEELVINQMKADNITKIHQSKFVDYLIQKGLIVTTNIPQELYEDDGLRLEDEYFVFYN